MLFRIWFLVLCKIWVVAFAAFVVTSFLLHEGWAKFVYVVCSWAILLIGVAGAILGVVMLFIRKMHCPMCGKLGDFVVRTGRQPGVECPRCGLVFAKDLIFSFRLCRESVADRSASPDVDT